MMKPTETIIDRFGSAAEVARVIGSHRSTVSRWSLEKSKGGNDGFVPTHYAQVLLDEARERGIALSPSDFFFPKGEA